MKKLTIYSTPTCGHCKEAKKYLNDLGIKGVGESGVIPMAAAIASAIDHALQSFDVTIRRVPVTPPDLVAQIERHAQS